MKIYNLKWLQIYYITQQSKIQEFNIYNLNSLQSIKYIRVVIISKIYLRAF